MDLLISWIQWTYQLPGSNGPINSLDGQIQLVWLSQVWGLGFLWKFLLLFNFFAYPYQLFHIFKISWWNLEWNYLECIDKFWESWHFKNNIIPLLNNNKLNILFHKHGVSFHLYRALIFLTYFRFLLFNHIQVLYLFLSILGRFVIVNNTVS